MSTRGETAREYGPLLSEGTVAGVAHDGEHLWFASGRKLEALSCESGEIVRSFEREADAGTAFDGRYLYQLAEQRIDKIDPESGEVVSSTPAPGLGGDSGMTWAEGSLWVGQYRDRKIVQIDPETGEVLKTIESDRFVTGVTWSDGALWHATSEDGRSDIRRVDVDSGAVLETIDQPGITMISGLTTDGRDFYCGGGGSRTIRRVVGS